jgi:hypothetical protein
METFEIQLENHTFTFKLLTWKEAIDIESKSYSVIDENLIPNIEKEKRNVLKKALISIQNQENKTSIDIESFFNIKHEIIEKIWQEFYKNNYLTANEAAFYYDAAKRYFNGDNNGPIPPIIIEVGLMLKNIISFNRDEFSKISMKEFEIINLVMSLKK